jgi:hypothetical protein
MTFKLLHKGREYILDCQNEDPAKTLYIQLETRFLTFSADGVGVSEEKEVGFYVSEVIPNPFAKKIKNIC